MASPTTWSPSSPRSPGCSWPRATPPSRSRARSWTSARPAPALACAMSCRGASAGPTNRSVTTQLVDTDTGGYLWAERCRPGAHRHVRGAGRDHPQHRGAQGQAPAEREDALRQVPQGTSPPTSSICAASSSSANAPATPTRSRADCLSAPSLDPDFARAHAGIAECEASLCPAPRREPFPIAETLARAELALGLEPSLARPTSPGAWR